MIRDLLTCLRQSQLALDATQVAEALWLAQHLPRTGDYILPATPITPSPQPPPPSPSPHPPISQAPPRQRPAAEPVAQAYSPSSPPPPTAAAPALPFRAPASRSLRDPLDLARSLRPLLKKVASRTVQVIDEIATAEQIATTQTWMPVLQAAPERWLDLALVVEETNLTPLWQRTIAEFQQLLEHLGAFRDVRSWTLQRSSLGKMPGDLTLTPRHRQGQRSQPSHHPKTLIDPAGRRLIIVISDCTSAIWWQGQIQPWLKTWSTHHWLSLVHLLPDRLWQQGALGTGLPVWLQAPATLPTPASAPAPWRVDRRSLWREVELVTALVLPVVTLEPASLNRWAAAMVGRGGIPTAGVLLEPGEPGEPSAPSVQDSPEFLVRRFQATASLLARQLAGLMAAAPLTIPVVELLQETLLPQSRQVHVAEVLMSGMVRPVQPDRPAPEQPPAQPPDQPPDQTLRFEFVPGVRRELLALMPRSHVLDVLNAVSGYIFSPRLDRSLKTFAALLTVDFATDATTSELLPFAQVTAEVLRHLGGSYAQLADSLSQRITTAQHQQQARHRVETAARLLGVTVQPLEYEVATLVQADEEGGGDGEDGENGGDKGAEEPLAPPEALQTLEFTTPTVDARGTVVQTTSHRAAYFTEALAANVPPLEMITIPGGSFLMGSSEDEPERWDDESPQHRVTVAEFFMGKTPIAQAQWRAVAALPRIQRELDPDPSHFKGDRRPVEQVSWFDAVEFCARLSRQTGRHYRLPSEAEWEYACRAGTTTPFSFGETITTDLANYDGSVYRQEPSGQNRGETTEVGMFPPNVFGLQDMHGNVWEWCLDHWHDSYEGAPIDGSPWLDRDPQAEEAEIGSQFQAQIAMIAQQLSLNVENENEDDNRSRVRRGGSWNSDPRNCRSATRSINFPRLRYINLGFRVICALFPLSFTLLPARSA